jgi:hypothetical protein
MKKMDETQKKRDIVSLNEIASTDSPSVALCCFDFAGSSFVLFSETDCELEYLNCLGSMITKDARRTREIKSRISMTTAVFNRKKTLQQIGLKFEEETTEVLHLEPRVYGAEIWALVKVDQKYPETFENVVLEKDGEDRLDR